VFVTGGLTAALSPVVLTNPQVHFYLLTFPGFAPGARLVLKATLTSRTFEMPQHVVDVLEDINPNEFRRLFPNVQPNSGIVLRIGGTPEMHGFMVEISRY
jgi:hypothetical protein